METLKEKTLNTLLGFVGKKRDGKTQPETNDADQKLLKDFLTCKEKFASTSKEAPYDNTTLTINRGDLHKLAQDKKELQLIIDDMAASRDMPALKDFYFRRLEACLKNLDAVLNKWGEV